MKITSLSLISLSLAFASIGAEGAIKAVTPAMPDSEWAKSWWPKRFAEKQELVKKGGAEYVFIGDSITQLFEKGFGGEVWRKFLKPDGTTDRAMFDCEYIHPSTEGYRVWREALEPVFAEILGK